MIILSIETSLDETAAAVVQDSRVLSNVVWSQIKLHRRYGGVVPDIARRAHERRLPAVVSEALKRANLANKPNSANLSAVAVTVGPGLAPALETGIAYAKKFAIDHRLPLIPVNHLEGHIASVFLRRKSGSSYLPSLANLPNLTNSLSLIVSGGHTELVLTKRILNTEYQIPNKKLNSSHSEFSIQNSVFHHQLLGQTLDDAAGECLDKVGRELGLGYPAGPVVEQLARRAGQGQSFAKRRSDLERWNFPLPLKNSPKSDLNFSFSGLKTAAIQQLYQTPHIERFGQRMKLHDLTVMVSPNSSAERNPAEAGERRISVRSDNRGLLRRRTKNSAMKQLTHIAMSKVEIQDFCFSFQDAVIDALLLKVRRAVSVTGISTVLLCGGVAANNRLRRRLGALVAALGGTFWAAPKQFTGDNAAMIGVAAGWAMARGEAAIGREEINRIDRQPNLNFQSDKDSASLR